MPENLSVCKPHKRTDTPLFIITAYPKQACLNFISHNAKSKAQWGMFMLNRVKQNHKNNNSQLLSRQRWCSRIQHTSRQRSYCCASYRLSSGYGSWHGNGLQLCSWRPSVSRLYEEKNLFREWSLTGFVLAYAFICINNSECHTSMSH